jgi:hypothetical protein
VALYRGNDFGWNGRMRIQKLVIFIYFESEFSSTTSVQYISFAVQAGG